MMKLKPGMVLRHHSGRVYTVVDIANEGSDKPEFPPMVYYIGANGQRWSRPLAEFEGRFTVLYDGTNLAPTTRDRIANLRMDDSTMADNLAVALCAYYETHPDRPSDDPENEHEWGEWVEEMANRAIERITAAASGADR